MLRIVDELAGPGPLRVCAHVPADGAAGTGLRVLLIADVLARVVELRGRAVLVGRTGPAPHGAPAAGVRPADAEGGLEDITNGLGGPPAVHVTSGTTEEASAACLRVGEAELPALDGLDPSAVRMLCSATPTRNRSRPRPTRSTTAPAARSLAARLAHWAGYPSKPIPPDLKSTARAALDARLDTRTVLRLLADLETASDVLEEPKSRPSPTSTASSAWNSSARWARSEGAGQAPSRTVRPTASGSRRGPVINLAVLRGS